MIDENFLHETGVFEGLDSKERIAFMKLCKVELDRRVGEALAGSLTDEQIETFEGFMNDGGDGAGKAVDWISKAVPDYQSIVLRVLGELKADVINNRDEILARS